MRNYFDYSPVIPFIKKKIESLVFEFLRYDWGRTKFLVISENGKQEKVLIRLAKSFSDPFPWWQPPNKSQSQLFDFMLFVDVKRDEISSINDVSLYFHPISNFDNSSVIHLDDIA